MLLLSFLEGGEERLSMKLVSQKLKHLQNYYFSAQAARELQYMICKDLCKFPTNIETMFYLVGDTSS